MSVSNIDNRIVKMEVDKRGFSEGIAEVIRDLTNLDKAMQFKGEFGKSLSKIGDAFSKLDFSKIGAGMDAITNRFSVMGKIGEETISRLTNKVLNFTESLTKSLTLDQISAGWGKFGDKTQSVATLMGQGYELSTINQQLDKLNWFTDETSYNFVDMVKSISKFTATGQKLPDSVEAMMGIANWAAKAGQNAATASNAMYQISQAMGAGAMRKEDYKSIQNASMDTKEFRQAAIEAALELKTLKKVGKDTYESLVDNGKNHKKFTLEQFTEELTEGEWLNKDVMMKVFTKYASAVDKIYEAVEAGDFDTASEAIDAMGDKIDEFGLSAFKAAQQARTWGDVVDSVKDAVSTNWMKTFELIIGDSEQATKLFTTMANTMWDIFAAPSAERNEILKGWNKGGGRDMLLEGFGNIWKVLYGGYDDKKQEEIVGFFKAISSTLNRVETYKFPTVEMLLASTKKFNEWTAGLKVAQDRVERIAYIVSGATKPIKWIFQIIGRLLPKAVNQIKVLSPVLESVFQFINRIENKIGWLDNFIVDRFVNTISTLAKPLGWILEAFATAFPKVTEDSFRGPMPFIEYFINKIRDLEYFINNISARNKYRFLGDMITLFRGINRVLAGMFSGLKLAIPVLVEGFIAGSIPLLEGLYDIIVTIGKGFNKIASARYINKFTGETMSFAERFGSILSGIVKVGSMIYYLFGKLFSLVGPKLAEITTKYAMKMLDVLGYIADAIAYAEPYVIEFLDKWMSMEGVTKIIGMIKMELEKLREEVIRLYEKAQPLFDMINTKFKEFLRKLDDLNKKYKISEKVQKLRSQIESALNGMDTRLKKIDLQGLFDSVIRKASEWKNKIKNLFKGLSEKDLSVDSIVNFFRGAFESISREAKEKFGEIRTYVDEHFGGAIAEAKSRVDDLIKSIKGAAVKKATSSMEELRNAFDDVGKFSENARKQVEKLGKSIQDTAVFKFFSDTYTKLKTYAENSPIVQGFLKAFETIRKRIEEFILTLRENGIFERVKKVWDDFLTSLSNIDIKTPKDLIDGLVTSISNLVTALGSISSDTFGIAKESILGFFSDASTGFGKATELGGSLFQTIRDVVTSGLGGVEAAVKGFDWDKVANVARMLIGAALLKQVFDILSGIGGIATKGKGIAARVLALVDSFSHVFDATNFDLVAAGAIKMGQAAVLIAFALSVLAEIPEDDLSKAVAAIGGLMLIVSLLMWFAARIKEASADISIANAVKAKSEEAKAAAEAASTAANGVKLSLENIGKSLKEGFIGIADVVSKNFTKSANRTALALLLASITIMILSIVGILKFLSDNNITLDSVKEPLKIIGVISALIVGFVGLMAVINSLNKYNMDLGMVLFMFAFLSLLKNICKLVLDFSKEANTSAVWTAIMQIATIMIAIGVVFKLSSSFQSDAKGLGLFVLAFAVSLEILVLIVKQIIKIKGDIDKAVDVLASLTIMIGGMLFVFMALDGLTGNINYAGFALFAISFAASILILTASMFVLSQIPTDRIASVVVGVGLIAAALAGFFILVKHFSKTADQLYTMIVVAGVFVAVSAAFLIFAAAMMVLANAAPMISENFLVIALSIASFLAVILVLGAIGNAVGAGLMTIASTVLVLAAAFLIGAAAIWLIATALPEFVNSVSSTADSFMTLGDKIAAIFSTIIYAIIKGLMDAFTALVAGVFAGLDTFSVAMMDSLVPFVEHFLVFLLQFVGAILRGIGKVLIDLCKWVIDAVVDFFTNTDFGTILKNMFISMFDRGCAGIAEWFASLSIVPEGAKEKFRENANQYVREAEEADSRVAEVMNKSKSPEAAGEMANATGDAIITNLEAKKVEAGASAEELVGVVVEKTDAAGEKTGEAGGNAATSFVGMFQTTIGSGMGNIEGIMGEKADVVGGLFGDNLFSSATEGAAGIPDAVSGIFNGQIPASIDPSQMTATASEYFGMMPISAESAGEEASTSVSETSDEICQTLASAPVDQSVRTSMNNANRALESGGHTLTRTAGDIRNNVATTFSGNQQSFVNSGAAMVDGVIVGVRSREAELNAIVASLAARAKQAFDAAAGINSPAKIMIPSGESLPEGLAVGVGLGAAMLFASVSDLSEVVVGAAEESGLMDLANLIGLNLDLDTSPVITPVLDLRFVEEQSEELNRMLSGTSAIRNLNRASSYARFAVASKGADDDQNGNNNASGTTNNVTFIQNNTSPKALRRRDIYRDTKKLIAMQKEARA